MSAFSALCEAHRKCRLGKRSKPDVMRFEHEANFNLYALHEALKAGTYQIAGYRRFFIREPKVREIQCLAYADRVVQRSLCDNVIKPFFRNRLVYDNCACQEGKGTHFGLYRVCGFLREHYHRHGAKGWILKGDITKYFYSIPCGKLKEMILPRVKDERIRALLTHIIDSGAENGVGVPLGNQTSQWFALLYLDPLDRLVKEKQRIRHYSRYMDDFVLIHEDKAYLRQCLAEIKALVESLGLTLNPKTQIVPIQNGVDYLGFHIYLTETGKVIRKLRQRSKKGMKRRLQVYRRQYAAGELDWPEVRQRLMGWLGHARHGHTWHLQVKILRKAVFIKDWEKNAGQH